LSTEKSMTTTQLPSPGRRLADPAPAAPPSKPRRRPRHLREQISGWGMIAPAAVLLLAFVFLPARGVRRHGQLRAALRGSGVLALAAERQLLRRRGGARPVRTRPGDGPP